MTIDRVRHGRQIRLPEIGDAGQERLDATPVVIGGAGRVRAVEAAYVARAGIRVIDDANAEAKERAAAKADGREKAHADALASFGVRDAAARDVADGALRALLAMRRILGVHGGEDAK